jgi:cyanophycinase
MPGYIALVGGYEFVTNCLEMDRTILGRLGTRPQIVVLPTAAAFESPRQAAYNGVQHLKRLGARAEAMYILKRQDAYNEDYAAQLDKVQGVYFCGGDPIHLLETLRDTKIWNAIVGMYERGGLVAGSSAGAMVMGGQMWAPGEGWRVGLGLVPKVAIIPHHATVSARWDAPKLAATVAPGTTVVGVDEATALLLPDQLVIGEGDVTIYTPEPVVYAANTVVTQNLS